MQKDVNIPWHVAYSIADSACYVLHHWHASHRNLAPKFRLLLRDSAISSLRYLWSVGDPQNRALLAARVAVWLNRPDPVAIRLRVLVRESKRLGAAAPSNPTRTISRRMGITRASAALFP
jgi:hypothetical protein